MNAQTALPTDSLPALPPAGGSGWLISSLELQEGLEVCELDEEQLRRCWRVERAGAAAAAQPSLN
ncbi:hypothetical protein LZ017_05295 [Pelomonas sp. CA6]|uniref:hypothetical protein n=1 Tax=Pelomonas sp. CA6 TaxID=2907999 RepID=UPI001F4BB1C2|nr:hypothetical protein [Pelomonas sp. CA6]MCH7342793.1 hypothetical protein [Pelomonas sp. CA6]